MDILASGPDRPSGEGGGLDRLGREAARRALRLVAALPWRRPLAVAVVGLAAAGALLALRSGIDPVAPAAAAAADPVGDRLDRGMRAVPQPSYGGPWSTASPPVPYGRPPPYDRLPGRTPIPAPTLVAPEGDTARGRLPVLGPPAPATAERAAVLVVGRYCRRPERVTVALSGADGWTRVSVRVRLATPPHPVRLSFTLRWQHGAYVWTGAFDRTVSCSRRAPVPVTTPPG